MKEETTKVEIGYKDGRVVLNFYGTSEVEPSYIAWQPHEARGVAALLVRAADNIEGNEAVIEKVAEAIYQATWNNITDDPAYYEALMGHRSKLWKTGAPWDTNPDELTEHERDDYRCQAKAALKAMGLGETK